MNQQITVEIPKLTPLQLAEQFWSLDSDEMAEFFGMVGACALASYEKLGYGGFDIQMCYVSGSDKLTPNGARVMEIIGAFVQGKRLQPLL